MEPSKTSAALLDRTPQKSGHHFQQLSDTHFAILLAIASKLHATYLLPIGYPEVVNY
jgi:hypothetical protein